MHGREGGEERKRTRHMWTVPTRVATPDGSSSSSSSSANSFFKDGRKINIGDCALFKPPQDSPPFIGIIRWLTTGKDNKLKLGVNWLYRPAEVKLGKGTLLDAAPNEIFYSFHKDEIPAASLLHPCKVAFLSKGVELPTGISSFVCRRVYDITNKCLWWLTDQDYINERQEEVDQLLYKTKVEMHATVQSGGRSPKPLNGPTSTSQLKSGSDSIQNSVSSFSSQVKGKKRERGDQGSEPIKRERISKTDDGDSGRCRQESAFKSEIAKITEKGGLVESEGVEKLVQLMQPDRNEKKIDLGGRSMLAGVIAATDKFDCLSQFVQLRGLNVFDEWLQEVHKGKIGDAGASKENDKSVEEFLLVLLRALDKLPVNLQALQSCNIGKSVNHLRSHKNLEIQKKARSLVDTWKKRVEAEMNINDVKSGSNQAVPWPGRSRLPEVGNRHSGGSSDVAMKSSVTQVSASKSASVKLVQGESATRSASASPGSIKSVPSPVSAGTNLKEGQPRNTAAVGTSDVPLATARDEKSSSSSQSHNNSQSCSNDHTRTGGTSGKDDARSSSVGSMNVNKLSGGSSRPRKTINGFQGSTPSGGQREIGSSRGSSLHKNPAPEKLSHSGLSSEKILEGPSAESNSHKFIVKIPNRGRSPAQSVSGGSFEEPSIMNSRASSPVLSEKHDQFDRNLKEKSAAVTSDVNAESWQSNDFKDVLTGSDEGDGSPAAVTGEEHCRTGDETKKVAEVSKTGSSSSGNEHKSRNLQEASFSSIHALIESCVKYSEANASVSVVDDVGMNLLASVAAGEMSKSNLVSPTDSPQRNTPVELSCSGNDTKVKSSDDHGQEQTQCVDGADDERGNNCKESGNFVAKNGDDKSSFLSEGKPVAESGGHLNSSGIELQQAEGTCEDSNGKSKEMILAPSMVASPSVTSNKTMDTEGFKPAKEKMADGGVDDDSNLDNKHSMSGSLLDEVNVNDLGSNKEVKAETIEGPLPHPGSEIDNNIKYCENEGMNSDVHTKEKPPILIVNSESVKGTGEEVLLSSDSCKDLILQKIHELKPEKADAMDAKSHVNLTEKQRTELVSNAHMAPDNQVVGFSSGVAHHNGEHVEENLQSRETEQCGGAIPHKVSPVFNVRETEHVRSTVVDMETDEAEECTSTTADASSVSAAGGSDADAKIKFDLNEGFNADDGKDGDPNNLSVLGSSSAVSLISPLSLPVSSVSSGLPASITVAAAAKGPFVPPEDLLRSKGELGWKGSAATSAFRPAEPRKVLEMPLGATNISHTCSTAGKQGRPLLDIDLNVPDERILEDLALRNSIHESGSVADTLSNHDLGRDELKVAAPVRSSGGLDLDLNRVDEASDLGNYSISSTCKIDPTLSQVKSSSGGTLSSEVCVRRDFDLNGPVADEVGAEPAVFSQRGRSSVPSQPPVSGHRMNNAEVGNYSSWFPPGSTYPAVTIPSIMPDRGEQPFPVVPPGGPQRILGPPAGSNPFSPDVYRGSVLSSSPAMPFPPPQFQYPVFNFGATFPLPAATFTGGSTTYMDSTSGGRLCFPAVPSQLLGPAGLVSSSYTRPPYVVSLPDGNNNSNGESSRKWGRQGLDLNAGPGGPDIEGRDESSPLASRQLSVASSQALAEEQLRMFQIPGGTLKRKEPEGGWDGYKQSSWQ
ncbi:uncharacterized protein LOC107418459 [Ziziphus jujuba]|uniref:Uncharacterized protein LOC107418459 n=1 Tax=Ziziphus jujuba TaxID=326968 RepID=A0A6P3ZPK2_ZIZJJ|nr:uncharacterized protein LOC107418459 [Ziziphus jujuba]XP_024929588.3 uncharacterized protein LOC107418459 [Ziziphus jujuba]